MPPEEIPKVADAGKPLDAELRRDLHKQLAMALPTALIALILAWLSDKLVNNPGPALLVIVPGIICLAIIFVRSTVRQRLKLGWPFLAFLPIYILVFYLAAETRVLDWKRTLVGYEDTVPRNFLALNHYGDWHYKVAAEAPELPNLAIVLMHPAQTIRQGRQEIADMIAIAQSSGARGVALDFYFEKYQEEKSDQDRGTDEYLCSNIISAREKDMKIFIVDNFKLETNGMDRVQIDPDLEKCLAPSDRGHLLGYAEADGVVRSIPLYFWNDPTRESLSLKIARTFDSNLKVPSNGLLQFIKPKNDFRIVTFTQLDESEEERSMLNDRFLLVGEDSAQDSFDTPFGRKPGVMIHAYAVQSLLRNQFVERPPWWLSLLMISVWCYLMMVLMARGTGNLKLTLINAAVSLFIVGISVLAMRLWLTWIDLIYPLLATWLFLLLLIALGRIAMRKTRSEAG